MAPVTDIVEVLDPGDAERALGEDGELCRSGIWPSLGSVVLIGSLSGVCDSGESGGT